MRRTGSVIAIVGTAGLAAALFGFSQEPVDPNLKVFAAADLATSYSAVREDLAMPDLSAVPSGLVNVELDEDVREIDVVIGPLDLADGMAHLRLPIQMATLPVDGWMHGFEAVMRDAEGNELPSELLHHVNLISPDRRDLFTDMSLRVMAAGRETQEQKLPRLVGYPISAGDRLLVNSMFANTTGEDHPEAYLHVKLFYSAEGDGLFQPRDVYPFYLDVMGPIGVKDFPVPAGGSTAVYWEGSPAVEGRILGIGGHLHNYATELRLEDMTTGTVIWNAAPELDEQGAVTGVPTGNLWWHLGTKIYPDHVYRIYVEYDNPTGAALPDGGMGAIGGVVWIGKDVEWPGVDPENPVYLTDVVNTLESPEVLTGHGAHGNMEMGAEADVGDAEEADEHADHSGH